MAKEFDKKEAKRDTKKETEQLAPATDSGDLERSGTPSGATAGGSALEKLDPKSMGSNVVSFLPDSDLFALLTTSKTLAKLAKAKLGDENAIAIQLLREEYRLEYTDNVMIPDREHLLEPKALYQVVKTAEGLSPETEEYSYAPRDPAFLRSALGNDIPRTQWSGYLKKAARVGNLALVEWLAKRVYMGQEVLDAAVRSGNLPLVKYLLESKDIRLCSSAWVASDPICDMADSSKSPNTDPELIALLKSKGLTHRVTGSYVVSPHTVWGIFVFLMSLGTLGLVAMAAFNKTFGRTPPEGIPAIQPLVILTVYACMWLLKKALIDREKFAIGLLVLTTVSLLLPLMIPGLSYLNVLAPLTAVLMVSAIGWAISKIYRAPPDLRQIMKGLVAIYLAGLTFLIGAVTFGPGFAKPYLSEFAWAMPLGATAMVVSFVIMVGLFYAATKTEPLTDNIREDWALAERRRQQAPQVEMQPLRVPQSAAGLPAVVAPAVRSLEPYEEEIEVHADPTFWDDIGNTPPITSGAPDQKPTQADGHNDARSSGKSDFFKPSIDRTRAQDTTPENTNNVVRIHGLDWDENWEIPPTDTHESDTIDPKSQTK